MNVPLYLLIPALIQLHLGDAAWQWPERRGGIFLEVPWIAQTGLTLSRLIITQVNGVVRLPALCPTRGR